MLKRKHKAEEKKGRIPGQWLEGEVLLMSGHVDREVGYLGRRNGNAKTVEVGSQCGQEQSEVEDGRGWGSRGQEWARSCWG